MISPDIYQQRILMCYGKTPFTPGRYLEDGLRSIGVLVDVYEKEIDFNKVCLNNYSAILFVESPSRPSVEVKNIDVVKIPKVFWIHHGDNRLQKNLELHRKYKPDLILMAHSLQLAHKFSVPVRFFTFAMAKNIFNCSEKLNQRDFDVTFVGNKQAKYYEKRNLSLKTMEGHLGHKNKLSLHSKVYLEELAKLYGQSKIVFNQTADNLKTMNMRIFEGMGCGALVLTDPVPEQEKIFEDGKHYVVYKDNIDLVDKVNYYLSHLDEAQAIALAGYEYVKSKHTYEHRAHELLTIIEDII